MNQVMHRLKIASGHLNKVIDMQEQGEYCIDVMLQLQAVEKALKNVGDLI
ncbi:metal-sensing transcriptional repressor, partial [Candidatus Microgenomates bacterium]|nr:metal-sensing transcriptional repressor [Candidatus Microgenomates bacterium]